MGSLLAFARLLLLPPASFLSPTLSSLGACGRGEVLCPFLFGTASPCPSLTLCTLVCLQSPRYTPSWQFLPSNLLLLRPHWGVGGGSWGDSQGLREHVKMLPLGEAGGGSTWAGLLGPRLDSDFETKLTHLKPHVAFIWKH